MIHVVRTAVVSRIARDTAGAIWELLETALHTELMNAKNTLQEFVIARSSSHSFNHFSTERLSAFFPQDTAPLNPTPSLKEDLGSLETYFATAPSHPDLPCGIYRHYKNKDYAVLGVSQNAENGEECVLYRALYGERALWLRPLPMFKETIKWEDRTQLRFAPCTPEETKEVCEREQNLFQR